MKALVRYVWVGLSLSLLVMMTTYCGNLNQQNRSYRCGEGYEYTATGCVPQEIYCDPACTSDEICRKEGDTTKCVARVPLETNQQPIECTIACNPGEVCQEGRCVSVPCNPACKAGYICSRGECVLREECNPPCPQFGFVCVEGACEKICVPACDAKAGMQCIQGVCEKICNPACNAGSFCRGGSCVKLQDADGDKYPVDRDCDDNDKEVNPGGVEICDEKDNDCDGKVDNIEPKTCYTGPSNSLGRGDCRTGTTVCDGKKQICKGEIAPQTETCNNKDDDCDGSVDESCPGGTCQNGKCSSGNPEPTPEPTPEPAPEPSPEPVTDGGTTE